MLTALPSHIRSALVGHDSVSLEQYAAIADSMLAVAQRPINSFIGAIDSKDSNNYSRKQNFTQYKNNQPRPFYDKQRPRVCNGHIYFGKNSRSCRRWCEWPDKPKHILENNERTPRNSRPSSPTNS